MKRVLIVSYDLVDPGQNYEDVLKKIKGCGAWARLGGSAYLVFTEMTPVEVRDTITPALDSNDKIYVGVASAPSAWRGMPKEVSAWLHEKQK